MGVGGLENEKTAVRGYTGYIGGAKERSFSFDMGHIKVRPSTLGGS
jgi:hypothetical protein